MPAVCGTEDTAIIDLPATKTCTKCGLPKDPETDFYWDSRRGGYRSDCKDCVKDRSAAYQAANPEKHRANVATWAASNPEKISTSKAAWAAANPERARARHDAWAARVRVRVFNHYGTICACCRTTERLTIDHINGGGRQHREELGYHGGIAFYAWLIKQKFPEGYQTLCHSCNNSKHTSEHCRLHGAKLVFQETVATEGAPQ